MPFQENFGFSETEENKVCENFSENSNKITTINESIDLHETPKDLQWKKDIDFDELLPYVGEFGKYQKILFLLMIPFATFMAWVYFSQIFITLVPEEHWCRVPELENLSMEERLSLSIPPETSNGKHRTRSRCTMYDVNYTEILINGIIVADSNWPITKCRNGWEFNFTVVPYTTIATELNWVCEDATLPTYAQSIFFVGAIFGGLIFGWIADRYGRVPALVGTNIVGCFSGVATAFSQNFWQFSACRFLCGFAFDNCFTMMYILVLEYVGPKWRTFVANMSIALFFTFAASVLPWIAYYLSDWKMTCIVTSVPLILAVSTPWLVPESARWLVSQGKVEKAIGILKKFERINGTKVPEDIYKNFKDTCAKLQKEEDINKTYSVRDLFKSPRLRKITLLLLIIWMIIALVFDGHARNVDNLGLNVFITFSVATATEFPADVLLILTLDRWGRRWLAFSSLVLSGIFSVWASSVSNNIYAAVLAIMGRFFINISYNIGVQYAAELLPTVVRAQGVALIHIMGYAASIAAPFIVYLDVVSPVLPLLVLGILGMCGGTVSLFLPETLNKDLPQTLQDGENFGRDQSMWDVPCLFKKSSDPEIPLPSERSTERNSLPGSTRSVTQGGELRITTIQRSSVKSRKNIESPIEVAKL